MNVLKAGTSLMRGTIVITEKDALICLHNHHIKSCTHQLTWSWPVKKNNRVEK